MQERSRREQTTQRAEDQHTPKTHERASNLKTNNEKTHIQRTAKRRTIQLSYNNSPAIGGQQYIKPKETELTSLRLIGTKGDGVTSDGTVAEATRVFNCRVTTPPPPTQSESSQQPKVLRSWLTQ